MLTRTSHPFFLIKIKDLSQVRVNQRLQLKIKLRFHTKKGKNLDKYGPFNPHRMSYQISKTSDMGLDVNLLATSTFNLRGSVKRLNVSLGRIRGLLIMEALLFRSCQKFYFLNTLKQISTCVFNFHEIMCLFVARYYLVKVASFITTT